MTTTIDNPQLSSLKLKISLPKFNFSVITTKYSPLALQAELALRYKKLFYSNLIFDILPLEDHVEKFDEMYRMDINFREKIIKQNIQFPYIYVYNSLDIEKACWLNGIDELYESLDLLFPKANLLLNNNDKENITLQYLFNNILDKAYWVLLMLNNKKLINNNNKYIQEQTKQLTQKINAEFKSTEEAYESIFSQLKQELIPLIEHHLQNNTFKFLFADRPYSADISLYSYICLFQKLQEGHIFKESELISEFINNFEIFIETNNIETDQTRYNKRTTIIQ